jgi:hypothetical protein
MEHAIHDPRVVSRGNPGGVDRVRLVEQVPELRERVASHTRNGGAASCVLVHEVVDDILAESSFEIEDVVRHS